MYRVYIGTGSDKNGNAIEEDRAQKVTADLIDAACDLFGGATISHGHGVWRASSGQAVKESVLIVDIGTHDFGAIEQFAGYARDSLNQSSVAVQKISDVPIRFV